MSSPRDVVITGIGVVSPIGVGRDAFAQSLVDGVSGVATITQYDASALAVRIGAELKDFNPKLYVKPRKSIKVMCREIQMGVASANLAMEDAAYVPDPEEAHRFGVVYGVPMLYADISELDDLIRNCVENQEFHFEPFGDQFPKQLIPLWLLKYLPNMAASHIGIAHNARGPNNSIVHDDMSSTLALIEAKTVIERGMADVMLTGGSGNRLAITPVVYRGASNLSKCNQDPTNASRPFDADRDGMVLGEGSGSLLLESRAHAEARGAHIYGVLRGHATTHRGSAGNQAAIERSIASCLERAQLRAEDVDHVNAHGLSDIENDQFEATAIREVLNGVAVTALKSFFGNVGAASGVTELAASLLMAQKNRIPRTLNYRTPDASCPVHMVTEADHGIQKQHILKLNQCGTGQAAAVLVELP